MGAFAGFEACGIVSSDFPASCAFGGYAVKLAHDTYIGRLEPFFEIRAYRCYENQEKVFGSWFYAYLCRNAYLKRTDVERCSASVGRHEALVELHYFLYHFGEELYGDGSHHDSFGRLDYALGVFLKTEYAHFAVLTTEGLQTFKYLLSIMQCGGGNVEIDCFGL